MPRRKGQTNRPKPTYNPYPVEGPAQTPLPSATPKPRKVREGDSGVYRTFKTVAQRAGQAIGGAALGWAGDQFRRWLDRRDPEYQARRRVVERHFGGGGDGGGGPPPPPPPPGFGGGSGGDVHITPQRIYFPNADRDRRRLFTADDISPSARRGPSLTRGRSRSPYRRRRY